MIKNFEASSTQMVFRALSDPTRRDILMLLSEHDMTIHEVTEKFDITRAAVKKHLKILEDGELISVHISGRERINRLEPNNLKCANEWLNYFSQFWDERLNRLQEVVEKSEMKKTKKK